MISIDRDAWLNELGLHAELFQQLAPRLPAQLLSTKKRIEDALAA